MIARVAISIILGKDGNLIERRLFHFGEEFDDGRCLFLITGAVIENVAIGRRQTKQPGAGISAEENPFPLHGERNGHLGGRRADIADGRKDFLGIEQLVHVIKTAVGLVAVVERDQAKLAALNAALIIDILKTGFNARAHAEAEFRRRPGEGGAHAQQNLLVRYADFRSDCFGGRFVFVAFRGE